MNIFRFWKKLLLPALHRFSIMGWDDALIAAAVVSALASAAGTATTYMGQQAVKKKQDKAMAAEAQRQRDIDKRKKEEMDAAIPEFEKETQEAGRSDIADALAQYYEPVVDSQTEYSAGDRTLPKEVTESYDRSLTDALRTGQNYARDRANLTSYGRKDLENKIGLNRLGERVGDLNTEALRSADALDFELSSAYNKGVPYNTASAIAGGVGGIADSVLSYQLLNKGIGAPKGGGGGFNTVRGGNNSATTIPTGFNTT